MKQIRATLSSAIVIGLIVFFSAVFAGEKLDTQILKDEEFNRIVNELIINAKKGDMNQVKGLGTKLCRFKCDSLYDAELGLCGPGPDEGPLKECRDNAKKHRDTCKRGC